jgi:TnpA family transposase
LSFAKRFIGAESLPAKLSDFDVQQFFALSKDDAAALGTRFRSDRRVGAAIQMLFLRASGRPLDRFAVVPRTLLRSVCEGLGLSAVTIASLRTLYSRRSTLYEHQAWARAYLNLRALDNESEAQVRQVLAVAAREATHPDDLFTLAQGWLYEQHIVIPGSRRITDWVNEAFNATEVAMALAIECELGRTAIEQALKWAYSSTSIDGGTHIEWLKTPPGRHAPSTMSEVLKKIRALKALGVHTWVLASIALSKQQAYAARVQSRRPSMTARIEQQRQSIEIVCFLRVSLLELTDIALTQATRRSQQLFRRAAERVQKTRSSSSAPALRQALKARTILHDESKPWRDRVLDARAALDEIAAGGESFAAQVRQALAEDNRRVRACLAGLRELQVAGLAKDPGFEQWQAWCGLHDARASELPPDFRVPVGAAWSPVVHDLDSKSGLRAFEACTMMSLRRSLRRGSAWVDHSITYRARSAMLLSLDEWSNTKAEHLQILGLPEASETYVAPIMAGVSAGMIALAEAVSRGKVEIGADGLLHLPAIAALTDEGEPRKTREAIFKQVGNVQLPDLLLEVDAACQYSEALLGRRAASSADLLAVYGALLAHGTDNDAKGVCSMIPGIDAAHISGAMRAVEIAGRMRRANDRVAEYQNALPMAAHWGDGTKGSADMMALDASRHLWTARVDPRRRTFAAGIYTHVRDRWGVFYDQPIVLNERQAGVAVEGVERHNRAEDRIRVSLLAVDTHGMTNVAMAIAKLLGFDLCPRLRDLRERKLYVPRGWPVPEGIEAVAVRRVSVRAIERGWGELVHLVASIRAGKVSAQLVIHRLGSAAAGDPLHRAAEHLGRLLRTLFLCDYLAIEAFRREIHTLLNRGESVHQLQRAIYSGRVAPERGRRREEMVAISGAHALLTNVVLAWNTQRMGAVVARLREGGLEIDDDWLRRLGPAHFGHINFRGILKFNVEKYADALLQGAAAKQAASP